MAKASPRIPTTRVVVRWRRLARAALLAALGLVVLGPPVRAAWSVWQLANLRGAVAKAVKAHQVSTLGADLTRASQDFAGLYAALNWMPYARWVPGVGPLYTAARHVAAAGQYGTAGLNLLWPDLQQIAVSLGYRTGGTPVTGRERIAALVKALPKLVPALHRAQPDFQHAVAELNQVHAAALPSFLQSHAASLTHAQQLATTWVSRIPGIIQSAGVVQQVLGVPTQQRYLLLFQNSGELRPTGGFMTAYSLVTVHQGLVGSLAAHNIYSLASSVQYRPPAPPILHYVYTQHWHIRDANLSPNVPTTVGYINRFYQSIPHAAPINGMVFVDTWFVDNLLADVGPITMPASYHHLRITAQNANYEMEYIAEMSGLPSNTRKAFIGVMMKDLIHRVLTAHGGTISAVLNTVQQALNQKLLVFYFNNPRAEAMVQHFNWGGTMDKKVPGDYLEVVDANLGGHKDNYFMHYAVATTLNRQSNGQVEQTVTITWTNPAVVNNWLVVPYLAWVRIYVPTGSTLLGMSGDINGVTEVYQNHTVNKMVFGNHISLPGRMNKSQPPAVGSMTIRYLLPKGLSLRTLTIQKQPGIRYDSESVTFGRYHRSFTLTHDVQLSLPQ
ncbi:MAG: DUF4012 domain-containing protein [Thermaerobacter sp.]|nr:DUF4012 domain-containing protein [Thermaerobacter sp.]